MNNDLVIIQLDRPRVLRFSHTPLKMLCELTGKSITELDENMDLSNFDQIEKMAYCALSEDAIDNNETLSLEKIPLLLDKAQTFAQVIEKLNIAWRIAFGAHLQPEGNQPEPGKQPAKGNSTGKKT